MFRERIKNMYNNLSSKYRVVADFLLDHPFEAAFMTASELGERLDVDTATVVRFARRLGYEGYPELRQDVRAIVQAEIYRQRTPAQEWPGEVGAFRRAVEMEHRHLDQLLAGLSNETIEELITAITQARRIFVIGQWAMAPLGECFALWLAALGYPVQTLAADTLSAGYAFRDLTAQDTLLALALTGHDVETLNLLHAAQTCGARLVVLAAHRSQAVARLADVAIICPGEAAQPMTGLVSLAAVLTALVRVLAARDAENYDRRMATFEAMYDKLVDGYRGK